MSETPCTHTKSLQWQAAMMDSSVHMQRRGHRSGPQYYRPAQHADVDEGAKNMDR